MDARIAVKTLLLAAVAGCAVRDVLQPTALLAQEATANTARTPAAKPTIVLVTRPFAQASGGPLTTAPP